LHGACEAAAVQKLLISAILGLGLISNLNPFVKAMIQMEVRKEVGL
jgi:hypothetical protein